MVNTENGFHRKLVIKAFENLTEEQIKNICLGYLDDESEEDLKERLK
jgi:hypothetical protein